MTTEAKPDTAPEDKGATLPTEKPADKPASLEVEQGIAAPEPTGDPALDIALGFFAKQGVASQSLAMKQAKAGDFSLLKAELAGKGAPGWEQYVGIMEQAAGREKTAAEGRAAAALAVVVEVCGGKEAWAEVKATIAEHASEAELAEINTALKAGGLVAKATAQYMKRVHDAAKGATAPANGRVVSSERSGGAPASGQALSPSEYTAAVQELSRKLGNRMDGSKEYKSLQARRRAYKG